MPSPAKLVKRLWRGRHRAAVMVAFVLAFIYIAIGYNSALRHTLDREHGGGKYAPILAVQDGHKMYLQVMSLVFDRDLDIENQVDEFGYPGFRWKTDDGRPIYPHGFGAVLVWAPALAIAHGASKVSGWFGSPVPDHGYTYFHQWITYFTSVILVWLVAVIGYRLARRLFGQRLWPACAAFGVLLGTNLIYYAIQRPDYNHAVSAFVCGMTLFYWAKTIGDMRWRRFMILGALVGASGMVRFGDIFIGIVLVVEVLWLLIAAARKPGLGRLVLRYAARGSVALVFMFIALLPQILVWRYHYEGAWLSPPHGEGYTHLGRPMLLDFLFSPFNGFFYTHPLAYLGTLGLLTVPKRHRLIGVGMFVFVCVEIYANSCVYDWHGMASFGARRMVCTSIALVIGLGSLLTLPGRLLDARAARRKGRPRPAWMSARVRDGIFGASRGAGTALGVLFVMWFAIYNLSYDDTARDRRRPEKFAICCDELPGVMKKLAEPVWKRIGNPFAFPANVIMSRRFGVKVRKWEEASNGRYAARPSFHHLSAGNVRFKSYVWNIPGVHFDPHILRGFGPRQMYFDSRAKKRRPMRWTTEHDAAVLFPLFIPATHRVDIMLFANMLPSDLPVPVEIRFNGRVVFKRELAHGWQRARFEIPAADAHRGYNELSFRAPLSKWRAYDPASGDALLPKLGKRRVGVAVREVRTRILNAHR